MTYNSVTLNWSAADVNGGSEIKTYRIKHTQNGVEQTQETLDLTYTFTNLQASTEQQFVLVAINNDDVSSPESTKTVTTAAPPNPDSPSSFIAKSQDLVDESN